MTIFSQVAEKAILDAIENQITSSKEKDIPRPKVVKMAMSFFGPERDHELALKKRDFLQALIPQIHYIVASLTEDKITKNALISALQHCKASIEVEAKKKNRARGTTEILLDNLIEFVKKFYAEANSLQLINQLVGTDAFSHFSVAVATYYAKRTMDDIQMTIVQSTLENPSITSLREFKNELDKLVKKTYVDARFILAEDNPSSERDIKKKNSLGIILIDYLRLAHEEKHTLFAHTLSGNLSLHPRYLQDYLSIAKQAVDASCLPAMPITVEKPDDFDELNDQLDAQVEELLIASREEASKPMSLG